MLQTDPLFSVVVQLVLLPPRILSRCLECSSYSSLYSCKIVDNASFVSLESLEARSDGTELADSSLLEPERLGSVSASSFSAFDDSGTLLFGALNRKPLKERTAVKKTPLDIADIAESNPRDAK